MKHYLIIETEPPPDGQTDHAPKEFEGKKKIGNVLELLVVSMRSMKDIGVLTWCGRTIKSITFTQKEE